MVSVYSDVVYESDESVVSWETVRRTPARGWYHSYVVSVAAPAGCHCVLTGIGSSGIGECPRLIVGLVLAVSSEAIASSRLESVYASVSFGVNP